MKYILFILLLFSLSVRAQVYIGDLDDTAQIYFVGGQSNPVGRDKATIGEIPDIYKLLNEGQLIYADGDFQILNVYTNNQWYSQYLTDRWGFVDIWSRNLKNTSPYSKIYILKVCIGGTSMCDYWKYDAAAKGATSIYSACNFARNYFTALGKPFKFVQGFWYQGETDMFTESCADMYRHYCDSLFRRIRTMYTRNYNLPIVFIRPSATDPALTYRTKVRNGIDSLCDIDPLTTLYDIDDQVRYPLRVDLQHIDSLAHINLGFDLINETIIQERRNKKVIMTSGKILKP